MGASYRADIDGLRAVAVLPVLFFHAGIPGFSGGFVGVDVFFVISGYLITSLISAEIAQGRFSLLSFYERRVRRIFPALFAVVLASAVAAWFLFFPPDFQAFGRSVAATALFSSNVLFWSEAGYFDAAAHTKPLLHTWSLAVEEQFYVFFPLLLMATRRWPQRPLIVAGLAASFALCVWATAGHPSAAFYLAPTRAWELFLGAALAMGVAPRPTHRWQSELAGLAGLGLIGWAVFRFSAETAFPGANALFPCLGAVLIIYAGWGTSVVSRLLALRPLVFVGLISYSLYLWHWPLLTFANHLAYDPPSLVQRAGLLCLSFVLAVLSWRFVEQPFRRRAAPSGRTRLFAGAIAAMAGAVVFGVVVHASGGWPSRLPEDAVRFAAYARSIDPRKEECLAWPGHWVSAAQACVYGADAEPTIAIWGDSHAGTLAVVLGKLAAKHGESVRLYAHTGCPPLLGVAQIGRSQYPCIAQNAQVAEALTHSPVRTVVLLARYPIYLEGFTPFGPAEVGTPPFRITDETGRAMTDPERRALFAERLRASVALLEGAGKRVVIVYPVPETGYNIPTVAARMRLAGLDPAVLEPSVASFRARSRFVTKALDEAGSAATVRIRLDERLCGPVTCKIMDGGRLLYFDDNHLSLDGADYVAPLFEQALFPAAP